MRKAPLNTKGFGLVAVLLVVVVLAIISGSGAYVYHKNHKTKTATTTASASKSSSSTQNKTPTPKPVDPYVGWKQYCSAQEKSCFKYPADWTTKDVGATDPAGDGLQITSPSGTIILFQSTIDGLGGACQPSTPDVFIHKVMAQPNVSNLYIIESGTKDGATNHISLANGSASGQAPKVGDTGSCVPYTTFTSHHDASTYAWFESNGISNFKLSDLSTAELILKSYTY